MEVVNVAFQQEHVIQLLQELDVILLALRMDVIAKLYSL